MKKYLKQLKANKKGFTLIEMVVVIAIIGILAAILVPSMSGYLSTARESKQQANARTIFTAAQAAVTSLETETSSLDGLFTSGTKGNGEEENADLFKKISDLIGLTNYEKFTTIKVKVAKGGVDGVQVTDKGGDTVTYPEGSIAAPVAPTSN